MSITTEGLTLWVDGTRNKGKYLPHESDALEWKDLSGQNKHGTINGTAVWGGNFLLLNSSDAQWVNFGELNPSYVTLELFCELTSFHSTEDAIFSNYESGGYGFSASSSYVKFQAHNGSGYQSARLEEPLPLNEKVHLVGTFDGTSSKLYINGELKATKTASGTIKAPGNNTTLSLGGNPNGTTCNVPCLNGKIYSARVYSRALSQEEINQNYAYEMSEKPAIKFLVQSEGITYTVQEGALVQIEEDVLDSATFLEYGVDNIISNDLLITLINPKLLFWQEDESVDVEKFNANITATPFPQTIITSEIDLSHPSITGVEFVTVTYEGSPVFACSFDSGATWQMHNGEVWATLTENDTGMSAEAFVAITSTQWTEVVTGLDSFMIRFTLSTLEDKVTNIVVDYTN